MNDTADNDDAAARDLVKGGEYGELPTGRGHLGFSMRKSPRPSGRRLRPVFYGKDLGIVEFSRDDNGSNLGNRRRKTFQSGRLRRLRTPDLPPGSN